MFDPPAPRRTKTGWIVAGAILAPIVVAALVLGVAYYFLNAREVINDSWIPQPPTSCEEATGFPGLEDIVADSPFEIAEIGDWHATLLHPPTGRTVAVNALDWCNGYGPKPAGLTREDTGEPIPGIRLRGTLAGLPAWFAVPSDWAVESLEVAADGRMGLVTFHPGPRLASEGISAKADLEAALRSAWGSVRIDGPAFVSPDGRRRVVVRENNSPGWIKLVALFRETE
jgi:hypothetical protein